MEKTIKATEAVRRFSELLNRIKFRGNHYTILRSGKPVAAIGPADRPLKEATLGELKGYFKKIPRLREEAKSFEADLEKVIRHQPLLPEDSEWE